LYLFPARLSILALPEPNWRPPAPERIAPKQKRRSMSGVFLQLVPLAGIELATFALRMRCSTN
jgi:hypothetical protein